MYLLELLQYTKLTKKFFTSFWFEGSEVYQIYDMQVILFEIDCVIFYTNVHELFCQFINAENTVAYWDQGNTSDISGTKLE